MFWQGAEVRGLTNPTVCSYRPAETATKKAPFQLSRHLGLNMKYKEEIRRSNKKLKGNASRKRDQLQRGANGKKKDQQEKGTRTKQLRLLSA
jgi:hypothetical protein